MSRKKAVLASLGSILLISFILGTYIYIHSYLEIKKPEIPVTGIGNVVANSSSPYYAEIKIEPEIIRMDVGETKDISIQLSNGLNVREVSLILDYDDRYVDVVNAFSDYELNFSKSYIHDHYAVPAVEINVKLDKPVNSTTLAKITLKGISDGDTFLAFYDAKIYDSEGKELNCVLSYTEIVVGTPAGVPVSNEVTSFDIVELIIFTLSYITLPFTIIFVIVFAIVFAIGKAILKLKKSDRNIVYHCIAVSIVISLAIYLIILLISLTALYLATTLRIYYPN